VSAVSAKYPAYEFDFGDQPDPTWSQYLNVLYPGARDLQRMRNRRVVEALEAEGDSLQAERPVTHWIYFQDPAQRAVAVERLVPEGFQVEQVNAEDTADQVLGLRIVRLDRVDSSSIDTTVLQIIDLMDGLDAEYDGWECPVV
jgi:regulator of RNase E activity RraB